MLLEHAGKRPSVDPTAYVAPTAVVCGDVTVGPECRVLFGAVLVAEGGPVVLGARCVVMEHAVVRGTPRHPARLGDGVLVGPHAALAGCTVEDDVFLATGATVFNGARLGERSEVRVRGVVQVNTVLAPGALVPVGWVAVGDPAEVLPPDQHERINTIQRTLGFARTVWGLDPPGPGETIMPAVMRRYTRALGTHAADRVLDDGPP